VTITTPPRQPRLSDPIDREELERLVKALIEEARQRARRRRQKYAAFAVVASLVAVGITTILERSTGEENASLALAARPSFAGGPSPTIAFITGRRTVCSDPPECRNNRPPLQALSGKLFVVNTDGSGLRLVAQKASVAEPPAWSPDAHKLMFQSAAGIHVVNVDGSGLRSLTPKGGSAAWSPDGQRIAFVRLVKVRRIGPGAAEPDMEIYVMNAEGSGQQNLTRKLAIYADPAWSADGLKIAFLRSYRPYPMSPSRRFQYRTDLYVMNADGSEQQRLTRNPRPPAAPWQAMSLLAWSPDGQKILFQRRAKGENWEIFAINADGSGLRNLSRNRSHDVDADWAPDGRSIVFRTSRHDKWELYVMNADGSGQRRLTRTAAANESRPSWSPDGQKIAFTREVGHNFELYVMNADGSGQRRLTPNSPVDRWVAYAWSPAP
jgi:Tol biopolymer transport system component